MAGMISAGGLPGPCCCWRREKKLLTVSDQANVEVKQNLAHKAPKASPFARQLMLSTHLRIVQDPAPEQVQAPLE